MTLQPWTLLDQRDCLSFPPWLTIRQQTLRLPSGKVLSDFYEVALPDFAVVVAVTTDGQYILAREYKHGVRDVTLTFPAGLIDQGEDALAGARRELVEETGYESDDWQRLGQFVMDANRVCGIMHLFAARNCRLTRSPHLDDAEDIQLELASTNRVREALQNGEFRTAAGATAAAFALLFTV